jgi:putative phosphoesterase
VHKIISSLAKLSYFATLMTRIGILSDTHGFVDDTVIDFFKDTDEIWHAGDIGDYAVIEQLQLPHKIFRAVFGNIDDYLMRRTFHEYLLFTVEDATILMTHICSFGGGRYTPQLYHLIKKHQPHLLICGHSHILKVKYESSLKLLHINPGAYGHNGFHKVRTAIRLTINGKNFKDLEILELPRGKK